MFYLTGSRNRVNKMSKIKKLLQTLFLPDNEAFEEAAGLCFKSYSFLPIIKAINNELRRGNNVVDYDKEIIKAIMAPCKNQSNEIIFFLPRGYSDYYAAKFLENPDWDLT